MRLSALSTLAISLLISAGIASAADKTLSGAVNAATTLNSTVSHSTEAPRTGDTRVVGSNAGYGTPTPVVTPSPSPSPSPSTVRSSSGTGESTGYHRTIVGGEVRAGVAK